MFREMLEYKLVWKGKKMVKVDRFFPSSKKMLSMWKDKERTQIVRKSLSLSVWE